MNLHFTFSVREISEIADGEQTLKIPMYLSVEWEVFHSSFFIKYCVKRNRIKKYIDMIGPPRLLEIQWRIPQRSRDHEAQDFHVHDIEAEDSQVWSNIRTAVSPEVAGAAADCANAPRNRAAPARRSWAMACSRCGLSCFAFCPLIVPRSVCC